MRLPPLGNSRNPGNVATGAPGRGFASPPRRFGFLLEEGAGSFFPRDTESRDPGIANCCPGAGGAGFGVCATAGARHARAANTAPAQTHRPTDVDIVAK